LITFLRSSIIESVIKSNFFLLKLSEALINKFFLYSYLTKKILFLKYNPKKNNIIIDIEGEDLRLIKYLKNVIKIK
jgi:hypothetical protein